MKRRRPARPKAAAAPPAGRPLTDRLALLTLWVLILLPPLVFDPAAHESFRLPKEAVSEILVLLSLVLLCARSWRGEAHGGERPLRHPALLASLPLLAAAGVAAVTSEHPPHARDGFSSLAIGAAALVVWSLTVRPEERRRLLAATIVPATLLSVIVILQFHRVWEPFVFAGEVRARLGLTSLAGGAFDLAAYLVLPILVAQQGLRRADAPRARWIWGLALAVCLYAMALTQTLTTLAALFAASLALWSRWLAPRRVLAALAVLAVLGVGLGASVEPLRKRLLVKTRELAQGDVNQLLTGRLDGWRAAIRMFAEHPATGIGPGAFTTEFSAAKLELAGEGVEFFEGHVDPHFASAHNEFLEVAAEQGLLGVLALAWGLFVVGRELARKLRPPPDPDGGLMLAGTVALLVLALNAFPLHLAIIAFPYVLLLSGVLASTARGTPRAARRIAGLVLVALVAALIWQVRATGREWRASRIFAAVKVATEQANLIGRLPPRQAELHLRLLGRAADFDPTLVDVPVARGWQYLLLGRPHGAVRAFEDALALEPRAEVYASLGQAHLAAGDPEAARDAFARAMTLDPRKGREIRELLSKAEKK